MPAKHVEHQSMSMGRMALLPSLGVDRSQHIVWGGSCSQPTIDLGESSSLVGYETAHKHSSSAADYCAARPDVFTSIDEWRYCTTSRRTKGAGLVC